MKRFKVNEFITLKLVNNETIIYVNEKKFLQCIRLILQIPTEIVHQYKEIDSIDEAAEVYDKYLHQNRIIQGPMASPVEDVDISITPEQEFESHCSNIQAWFDNGYDTRILHSNIAFPLLKRLADVGDVHARKIFKEGW